MKEILSSLEALFLQFNIRRLVFWLFLLTVGILALLGWETFTGYFFFGRMERSVEVLKNLHGLAQTGIAQDRDFGPIYQRMVTELSDYRSGPGSLPKLPEWFWKMLSGASLGLLVAAAGFADRSKAESRWTSLVGGGLAIALVAGIIGVFVPTVYSPWVNYVGWPVVQFIIILILGTRTRKRSTT